MNAPGGKLFGGPVRLALAGVAAMLVLAVAIGFVWLPLAKPDFAQGSLWDTICRAAGVPTSWSSPQTARDAQASRFPIVPTPAAYAGGDAGRGGTLALNCTMCHGARGVSASDVPNLAGQYPEVTYKQLLDYQNGQRRHALMQALARDLKDRDLRDLAAFYAQLPRPAPAPSPPDAPPLVAVGDPLRNIAPCASCHGGIDKKPGSPWLEGMPQAYLAAQLRQFAAGERRNDALGVMRNIARQMTAAERDAVAAYYAQRRYPVAATGER